MIPMQGLALEEDRSKHRKDDQSNHFLNHLQLHEGKRTTIFHKTDAIGWNLEKVLKKGDRP